MGSCVAGFSELMSNLFGARLELVEAAAGEVFHHLVQKAHVVDERGAVLGTMYLDLFARPDKPHYGCVYTIKSGCNGTHLSQPQLPVIVLVRIIATSCIVILCSPRRLRRHRTCSRRC